MAWFRSTARPNRFLSVITVAEIEVGVAATPDPVRQARYPRALAAVRHEYGDRITPIGEREAAACLTIHKTLKAAGTSLDPPDALVAATALANGWAVARFPRRRALGQRPRGGSPRRVCRSRVSNSVSHGSSTDAPRTAFCCMSSRLERREIHHQTCGAFALINQDRDLPAIKAAALTRVHLRA